MPDSKDKKYVELAKKLFKCTKNDEHTLEMILKNDRTTLDGLEQFLSGIFLKLQNAAHNYHIHTRIELDKNPSDPLLNAKRDISSTLRWECLQNQGISRWDKINRIFDYKNKIEEAFNFLNSKVVVGPEKTELTRYQILEINRNPKTNLLLSVLLAVGCILCLPLVVPTIIVALSSKKDVGRLGFFQACEGRRLTHAFKKTEHAYKSVENPKEKNTDEATEGETFKKN